MDLVRWDPFRELEEMPLIGNVHGYYSPPSGRAKPSILSTGGTVMMARRAPVTMPFGGEE